MPLFLVLLDDDLNRLPVRTSHMASHLAYLARQGTRVFAAGALREAIDEAPVGGAWIVEAASREEANTLVRHDPFFAAGLRRQVRIYHWGKAHWSEPFEACVEASRSPPTGGEKNTPAEAAWQIRRASLDDVDELRQVVRAAYAKWVPVIGREPMPMRTDLAQALQEFEFDVIAHNGAIQGLIATALRDDHLWIENIAVLPSAQGRGCGRRLLAHGEDKGRREGVAQLRLLTNAAFDSSLALYRSLGYVVEREEPFMGGVTVHMSKILT